MPPVKDGVDWPKRTKQILDAAGVREGYAVVWGGGSGGFISELVAQTQCHLVVIEPDPKVALALRRRFTVEDHYGSRVSILVGNGENANLPPYFATLMIRESAARGGLAGPDEAFIRQAFQSLRPFGGTFVLESDDFPGAVKIDDWLKANPQARVTREGGLTLIARNGPLPGSADWTHENADPANTRVSKDILAKAPMGLLWFGGPAHDGILPRHGHGPQPQVADGRMIIEGVDLIRAIDIYSGRLLWETKLPGVGAFFNNLAHQPGANASGSNLVTTRDGIYVALTNSCVRLHPATGKIMSTFKLPPLANVKGTPRWGYINVVGDYLIGGADPLFDNKLLPPKEQGSGNDDALIALTRLNTNEFCKNNALDAPTRLNAS